MPQNICITGASSGIGAETARFFARHGFEVILGARRQEKLLKVAEECSSLGSPRVTALELDVCNPHSCEDFFQKVRSSFNDGIDVLLNNAGLARGLEPLHQTNPKDWHEVIETNLMGLLRVTRHFLPWMIEKSKGHIINLGSVAGFHVYEGGAIYAATKHAVAAVTKTLRLELNGTPIRVTSIDPGMVETEFSVVRFQDQKRADSVYAGMTPLTGQDIAECIYFAATRPKHVNIDQIVLMPVDQASVGKVSRKKS